MARSGGRDWAVEVDGIASAAEHCNNWIRCRSDVEDDSPSRCWCKACVARVQAQRAAGALRAKMPSILAGLRTFGTYLLKTKIDEAVDLEDVRILAVSPIAQAA